ncbi:MAG: DUF438 domain-containing protein [candidate division WOR-3 bacterium]|nr:DUF438 domain-containing protein [candidate division WOR-3 bacterium]
MSGKTNKKDILKDIIKRLHCGENPIKIKQEFQNILQDTSPEEVAQIEEELIKEGLPPKEIQKLCDIHIALFKESLEKEQITSPAGHPIHILMEEHKILLQNAESLKSIAERIKSDKELEHLQHIIKHLKDSESHYLREENVLFPYLEKHGITQPPAIMWQEHDKIRGIKKNIYHITDNRLNLDFKDFCQQLKENALSLVEMLSNHFYKENNILFPTGLKVITENEWKEIRKEFDELGYCCFTPESAKTPIGEDKKVSAELKDKDIITFETGSFSKDELETLLNTLPIDITFVDAEDTVRYFSQTKERIFPRTKAVIGRKVQNCHPQKSVHIVNQILENFRNGKRDTAEFWINLNNRLIYIRYFAIRKEGKYLGCLEVSQDITDIKKIEGERRLLEWS